MNLHLRLILLISFTMLLTTSCAREATTSTSSSPVTKSPAVSPTVAAKTEMAQIGSNVIRSGTFASGEHSTQGTVQIINQNGKEILQLDQQFTTSTAGPDLVVALHRSANVLEETTPPAYPLKEGDYTVLAPLQQYSGAQSYEIPDNLDINDFQSAVIWCRQFNATFGAALLASN